MAEDVKSRQDFRSSLNSTSKTAQTRVLEETTLNSPIFRQNMTLIT
jgi:hypothetical protein